MPILKIQNLSFKYEEKDKNNSTSPNILKDITCSFDTGKTYALMGKSGSGKSTLLSLIGGLYTVREGEILYEEQNITSISKKDYLRNCCTMVYQNSRLFPLLTVEENISFPMELQKMPKKEIIRKTGELIKKVQLSETLLKRIPGKLSGGEQQRVAIARALAVGTKVLLADEPTGNLDKATGDKITELLLQLAKEEKYCVIIATHDVEMMDKVDKVYRIESGNLVESVNILKSK
ncbi:ABC transporter ATP-binding protein [Lachnospiraceae bacterium OttesenSCG-928-D06]|nr:ABC transporter ATP-binding protein [Lachnospiraceae bacterium OttesenSCG-928-D06]